MSQIINLQKYKEENYEDVEVYFDGDDKCYLVLLRTVKKSIPPLGKLIYTGLLKKSTIREIRYDINFKSATSII